MRLPITLWVDADEVRHLQRAVAIYRVRLGSDQTPAVLTAVVIRCDDISQSLAATGIDNGDAPTHSQSMTFAAAAAHLGVSRRTIGRYVTRGWLNTIGRKITTSSLASLLDSASGSTRTPYPASLRRSSLRRQPDAMASEGVAYVEPGAS